MKNVKRGLKAVGLTELEANVYLTLLRMKRSRVTRLAEDAGITRTQLYPLLEKMMEKGYVKRIKDSPAEYSVIETEKMEEMLESWLKEHTKLLENVRDFLRKAG